MVEFRIVRTSIDLQSNAADVELMQLHSLSCTGFDAKLAQIRPDEHLQFLISKSQ